MIIMILIQKQRHTCSASTLDFVKLDMTQTDTVNRPEGAQTYARRPKD